MSSSRSRIAAVILNWNRPAMTADCARAVLAQEVTGGLAVIVIDNGSSSENRAALRRGLPAECRVLQTDRNLGFAGGMNVGIRHALAAGYEYVWLLNNDAFPEPGCLARLVAALEADPGLACVTPALVDRDRVEQHAGAEVRATLEHRTLTADECRGPVGPGFWLTGTALLFPAAVLARVGGFDGRFFAYWEEVDLCFRAARVGYSFRAVPEARCVHLGSVSTGGDQSGFATHMMARNAWLFLRKHVPLWRVPATGLKLLSGQISRSGLMFARGQSAVARASLAGTVSGLTGRSGRPGRIETRGRWADAVLSHPWRLAGLIAAAARLIPTESGPTRRPPAP